MARVTATIDDQLRRLHTLAQTALTNTIMSKAAADAQRILDDARGQWPVRTGISRAGLHLTDTRTSTGGELAIVNLISYVPWIHGGAVWVDLVVDPMTALAADVSRNRGPDILTALRVQ